ncbi:MAG: hypothetical protein ACM3PD_05125 [Chloroflexota bacterium]
MLGKFGLEQSLGHFVQRLGGGLDLAVAEQNDDVIVLLIFDRLTAIAELVCFAVSGRFAQDAPRRTGPAPAGRNPLDASDMFEEQLENTESAVEITTAAISFFTP